MIKLIDVCKNYDETIIFDHFNLEISEQKITCILGESGVGKTTLLNMIAGLTKYHGVIEGKEQLSYIFQEPRLIPALTVKENLRFISSELTDEVIDDILLKLDILDKKDSYPAMLSGGEAQRVSIARAFLYDAPLILMDEPFSSLDLSLKYKLISYFSSLWKTNKKTVIFVTHDIDEALLLASDILLLEHNKIIKQYHIKEELPRTLTDNLELRSKIIKDIIKME